ncbi:MAG: DNA polymerase III subunit delta' [bacterium]|nr:DNA polymerase III subunit delta' [bacterium]
MPLSEIIGQDRAVEVIRRELANERIPQAYLFCGAESTGKQRTAVALAMALLCDAGTREGCGVCPSCRKIALGQHPDVRRCGPVARTKGAVEKIYIDQIRELQQEIGLSAMEGKWKVFIIDDADRMVDQAANALLKTLEEPPEQSLLILVAAHPDHLPATILSRCRTIRFQPLTEEALADIVVREKGVGRADALLLARYARGHAAQAMALDYDELTATRERLIIETNELDGQDVTTLFAFSEKFTRNTAEAIELLEFMVTWIRDLIAVKIRGRDGALTHVDRGATLENLCREQSLTQLLAKFDFLQEGLGKLYRNVNARMTVESVLVKMGDVTRSAS